MDDSLILYIVVALGAYLVGWYFRGIVVMYRLANKPEEMIQVLKQIQELNEHPERETAPAEGRRIKVELHNNVVYLFAEDTDQFLAQAPTLAEALSLVEKRFPKEKFVAQAN